MHYLIHHDNSIQDILVEHYQQNPLIKKVDYVIIMRGGWRDKADLYAKTDSVEERREKKKP